MKPPAELLYSWLPGYIRARDQEEGEPLRALMGAAQEVHDRIHGDIGQLYRSWFIETCPEWLVPYLGDLVGIDQLRAMNPRAFSLRAYVANAIALRRRKGTPAALEQACQDATGWHASAQEMFQNIAATQHVNHPRPGSLRTPSLRDADGLGRLRAPFERACHVPDVRSSRRYNLQTLSLFVWRLEVWPVTLATAAMHPLVARRWYHFDQLGRDIPLFNPPQTKLEPSSPAQERHLPVRLRRATLRRELEALRQAAVDGAPAPEGWLSGDRPPFRVYRRSTSGPKAGEVVEIPPVEILVADLEGCEEPGWPVPEMHRTYLNPEGTRVQMPISAVVDPELGRLVLTGVSTPGPVDEVVVDYHYGFASDLGGGEYDRGVDLAERDGARRYQVSREAGGVEGLETQLRKWMEEAVEAPDAVIEILDSDAYRVGMEERVVVPDGARLEIRAADRQRPVVNLDGGITFELGKGASLSLSGLWIHGGAVELRVDPEGPSKVSVAHCTLAPGEAGTPLRLVVPVNEHAPLGARVTIRRSVVGALELAAFGSGCTLDVRESIVDRQEGIAVDHGGVLRIEGSTVLGETRADAIDLASDVIFTGKVISDRGQSGCVRFSFVPPGSEIPPGFRCQPQLPKNAPDVALQALLPRFTSTVYGEPGYCQLASDLPDELLRGASDEGEMGAFNHLEQAQRRLNLQTVLQQHLKVGLEAQVVPAT